MRTIMAGDLFCGAGGASSGLVMAAERMGAAVHLVAVNHWEVAIETHSANHPGSVHYCQSVGTVAPREAVPGRRLDLLLAGPECTHHSNARGGKPRDKQSRASAWDIIRWCEELYVENILIENVPEFLTWGPLDENDQPIKCLKGMFFRQFVATLEELGYRVEHRILNAAHYGDATTRKRLFLQARRCGRIVWPKPSHMAPAEMSAYEGALPWVAAREIIDWNLPSQSIFGRKKPLAPNTLKRIMAGLNKFCGIPFLVPNFGERDGQEPRTHGIDNPLPTVTGHGAGCLVEPFLVVLRNNCDAQDLDSPAPTICAGGNHLGICQPFVLGQQSCAAPRSTNDPIPTVSTAGAISLIQPFLVGVGGPQGAQKARSVEDPLATILGQNHSALIEPFLVRYNGGDRVQSLDNPITTLDTSNRFGLVEPFLVSYYGSGGAQSVDDPLDTVTTRDRFGLVESGIIDKGDKVALLDIHFRMLQPHELAAAHSFPPDYHFAGGREQQVKQIGNSIPVRMMAALCEAVLSTEATHAR